MSAFLLVVAIVFGIWYMNKTNETIETLKKENQRLKKEIAILKGEEVQTTNVNYQTANPRQTIPSTNIVSKQTIPTRQTINTNRVVEKKVLTEEEKLELKKKKELEERERKNTTVLITGAILIVLAAIVFLMSTWNSISNIIKTAVLVLLIAVFFGASKIAKEKFKLEKASNTFFYLAMAYIPICFISCSIFSLFGKYLSIYGDGKYTYLAVSMVLTSGIYYLNYRIRKSIPLLYGSLLAQICSIILFGLIFEENILLISIMLLIYNIALILLTKKDAKIELLKYFYNGIPYILGVLAIPCVFETDPHMLAIIPLLTINYLLLYLKKDNTISNAYLFNIALYVFGIYLTVVYEYALININNEIRIILGIIYAIVVMILEGIMSKKDHNLIKSSMVVSLLTVALMYVVSLTKETNYIKPYFISAIEAVLMLLVYMKSKQEGKNILSILIPATSIITILHILVEGNAGYQLYIFVALIIFVIGELIRGKDFDTLNKGFFMVSHINIITMFLWAIWNYEEEILNDVAFFILSGLVYVYSFFKNREYVIFKYLSYISISIILLTGMNFIGLKDELRLMIPLILTIIVMVIEDKNKQINDSFSQPFINICSVITYFSLLDLDKTIAVVIGGVFSAYLIYNNIINKENKYLRAIPMTGALLLIGESSIEPELKTIMLLLATVSITFLSIYQKKLSLETVFSAIALFLTLDNFNNEYIQEIFFIIWSFANMYFMESEKTKDIFKAILYLGCFVLYDSFISEFDMNTLTCWNSIGVTILALVFMRNILRKYVGSIDNIEYIVYSIIYLTALSSYVSEIDGIVFVLFVVLLVMYSYIKKYGSVFIVSILAILVNAILLTREFWLSIPWWIYLLFVGALLIGFAIKNESDDKKEKINVGNVIKNIKDKIEN